MPHTTQPGRKILKHVGFGVALVAAILAISDAVDRRWLSDDAFISFRYARNLVDGKGLVFNAEERTEGYTNFLWTLFIAAGKFAGIAPEHFSIFGGILSFALLLILLFKSSREIASDYGHSGVMIPFAVCAAAAHLHLRIFATSGLETSMYTLLVTATIASAIRSQSSKQWLWTGLLGTFSALVRPDGLLFYGLAACSCFLPNNLNRSNLRNFFSVTLPGFLILIPYAIWKYSYYGNLLPNTWYAKSDLPNAWSQGFFYLRIYFLSYWPLFAGWIVLLILAFTSTGKNARWNSFRAVVLSAVSCSFYLVYVARVGGDFMFGRFCLPVTPLLFLGLELGLHRIPNPTGRLTLSVLLIAAIFWATFPIWLTTPGRDERGIVEESLIYPPKIVDEAKEIGECLKRMTAGTDTRVVVYGTQVMAGYYSEFPFLIEGEGGLTDYRLARMPVRRAKIGHSKIAPWEYLQQRGVHFVIGFRRNFSKPAFNTIDFGCTLGRMVTYQQPFMNILQNRGARFLRFEDYLDHYIQVISNKTPEQIRKDYHLFKLYYFNHNNDPVREAIIRRASSGETR
jgi:hypothetical protein